MEQIFFRLCDKKLDSLSLNKIGITIRKINDDEVNTILDKIFVNIINKDINQLIKYGKKILTGNNYDISKEKDINQLKKFITKYDLYEESEKYGILCLINLKKDFVFTRSTVKSILNMYYTIDIDLERYKKIYSESKLKKILLMLLDLSNFLANSDLESKLNINYYSLFEFNIINLGNFRDFESALTSDKFIINYNYDNLKLVIDLLNSKDIYFITSFFTSINFLNNSNDSIENDIVNKVSLIERFIIKEKSNNIQEQFILKTGAICFNGSIKNDVLSDILKSIYEIRSIIVHGNERLFFEKIDKYAKIFANYDLSKSKYENKEYILLSVRQILNIILKDFFTVFIKNNSYCEYIKNN